MAIDSVEYTGELPDVLALIRDTLSGTFSYLRHEQSSSDITEHMLKIADIYRLKGGWEVWLQVELGATVTHHFNYHGGREEAIYTNGGRVDLWCEPTAGLVGSEVSMLPWDRRECIGIELKCDNINTSPQKAFVRDIVKVWKGIKESHVGRVHGREGRCLGTRVHCVAVTAREADLCAIATSVEPEEMECFEGIRLYHRQIWKRGARWSQEEGDASAVFPMDLWLVWMSVFYPTPRR